MDYHVRPKHFYKPAVGFMNDPNGLVYFNGYYHIFYQYRPHEEHSDPEPAHWGHCRTKDFVTYEELPVALTPEEDYEKDGCWSGTATVRDGVLYLYYTGVIRLHDDVYDQRICVATSTDGEHFTKYAGNPIIAVPPRDGCFDHRDPAIFFYEGTPYLVTASCNEEHTEGRLLLFSGTDMVHFEYVGILSQFPNTVVCECPSMLPAENGRFILTNSVNFGPGKTFFVARSGRFDGERFEILSDQRIDLGPDQYAGQAFNAPDGRHLLLTWASGWHYNWFEGVCEDHSISCIATPREILLDDNDHLRMVPIKEWEPFLTDSDPSVKVVDGGLLIERAHHFPVKIPGPFQDVKIMRDEYFVEVFIDHGERIYSVVL